MKNRLQILLALFLITAPAFAQTPSIRVAILKNISEVTLEGNNLHLQAPETKQLRYQLDSPAHITPTKNGFSVSDSFYDYPFLKILSGEKTIRINGKNFEGALEIRRVSQNKMMVLNELPLEKYLIGLVHGEMNANWPREAIKAQVVAARTYALYRQQKRSDNKNTLYDLETGTADQVYAGSQGSRDAIVEEAIAETKGEVLWFLGLYPAYFHSCCGGQTETTDHAWGRQEASKAVVDSYCANSPNHNWTLSFSTRELLQRLKTHGLEGRLIKSIRVERFDNSPRNSFVSIETDKRILFLVAGDFRRILGYDQLKSTWFDVEQNHHQIIFKGTGYGHGVGLCQWGAKAMAEAGKTYREILDFYYPKAVVKRVY